MYEVDEYTVSLLHFDNGIKDETGKIWTANGGATASTADNNFGKSALYLKGKQYLSSSNKGDFSFGTGDFTVECWVKREAYSNIHQNLCSTTSDNAATGNPVGYGFYFGLGKDFKGGFGFYNNNSINSSVGVSGTTVIPVGEWIHIAGVRHNNTLYLFKNGILENTADCTGFSVNPNSATLVNIGAYANDAWGNAYRGYIDELRISNIARWTAEFGIEAPTNLTATAGDSQVTLS
ncbi:MAG: hypothetical protein K0R90_1227, partial [Oscillospiraceae bacterium]|nr:hypothetical protein [Oscillospiraceae bacterium]